jgi:hypothetical protein
MTIIISCILTGFFSIVYNVIWDRIARDFFGGDNISQTIIISAFLGGLGIGAYLFRKNYLNQSLQYGLLELAIGFWAFFSPDLFVFTHSFTTFLLRTEDIKSAWRVINAISVLMLVLTPSILMGGTFPSIMGNLQLKYFSHIPKRATLYYALNVLGAVLGIAAAAFYLLPNFEVKPCLRVIGSMNMLLGIYFICLYFFESRHQTEKVSIEKNIIHQNINSASGAFLVSFLSGFFVIFSELLMLRHIAMNNPGSAFNYPVSLIFILLSLTCAGFTVYFLRVRISAKAFICIALFLGGLGVLAQMFLSEYILENNILSPYIKNPREFIMYVGLLSFFALFPLGLIFPALIESRGVEVIDQEYIGRLYLFNSCGTLIAGAIFSMGIQDLSTPFLMICLAYGSIIAGLLVFLSISTQAVFLGVAVAILLLASSFFLFNFNHRYWIHGIAVKNFYSITNVNEGNTGTAAIGWYDKPRNGGVILINGQGMGSIPREPIQANIAMLTLVLAPNAKNYLELGIGSGNTVKYLAQSQKQANFKLVDWSRELHNLFYMQDAFLKKYVLDVGRPNINLELMDANIFMSIAHGAHYDVVSDAVMHPDSVGSNAVRNTLYFEKINQVIAPFNGNEGGVLFVSGFIDIYATNISSTLQTIFRYVRYFPELKTLVATNNPIFFDKKIHDLHRIDEVYSELGKHSNLSLNQFRAAIQSGVDLKFYPSRVILPLDYRLEYDLKQFSAK